MICIRLITNGDLEVHESFTGLYMIDDTVSAKIFVQD